MAANRSKRVAARAVHGMLACVMGAAAQLASAQQPSASTGSGPVYPAKTLRLIASQAPGGGIDTVARIVSSRLSEAVGQTVIVDNRAGANGSLAGELTANQVGVRQMGPYYSGNRDYR